VTVTDVRDLRHAVIGRGRLGTTVFRSLEAMGLGVHADAAADVVWLCVPDDALAKVAAERAVEWGPGTRVIHTSGHWTADLVRVRTDLICGSLHPAHPFPHPMPSMPADLLWTFEGDDLLWPVAEFLVSRWHGTLKRLTADQKPAYHTACVLLANLAAVPGLMAREVTRELDLPWEVFVDGLLRPLVEGLKSGSLGDRLTGPAARGDMHTIHDQMAYLQQHHPDMTAVYKALTDWIVSRNRT